MREELVVGVIDRYRELCNLTHPAGPSILAYDLHRGEGPVVELGLHTDAARIRDFCARHLHAGVDVLMFAINNGLVTLKVLNEFGFEPVTTPPIDGVVLDDIPSWRNACKKIAKAV